jgi:hypothetical protein
MNALFYDFYRFICFFLVFSHLTFSLGGWTKNKMNYLLPGAAGKGTANELLPSLVWQSLLYIQESDHSAFGIMSNPVPFTMP